jgi:rhodanese-related sulfurtransferase
MCGWPWNVKLTHWMDHFNNQFRDMSTPTPALPLETDCRTVKARLDQQYDFLLLDCRERDEHATAHIQQATLVPMSELANRAAELERYRDKDIVVHCHHGGRSLRVTNWLREQGFSRAQSMSGGIDAWSQEIDPAIPRY